MTDLFAALEPVVELAPDLRLARGYLALAEQVRLAEDIASIAAPRALFHAANAAQRQGVLGQDDQLRDARLGLGYRWLRYQPAHPVTCEPWPPIPELALRAWRELAAYPRPPQACLINFYDASARMGLHQDSDEGDFSAPVVSISLGDDALFRYRRAAPQ